MIQLPRFARWNPIALPFLVIVFLMCCAGGVHASRSSEPEPRSQQRPVEMPAPSPYLSLDSSMMEAPLALEIIATPDAELPSVPSDTTRPAPGSGLPNSESGWPGVVGFSFVAAAVLIFSLGLMLAPAALGAFLAFSFLLAWVGHYFAVLGMKRTRRYRKLALLACVFWGLLRVLIAVYFVAGFALLALWF